jgi:ABC-type multidrug transport system, ATPase and permease components
MKKIISYTCKSVKVNMVVGTIALIFLSALMTLPMPVIQKYLVNALIAQDGKVITTLLIVMAVSIVMKIALSMASSFCSGVFEERASFNIRKNSITGLYDTDYTIIKATNADYLHNRIKEDSTTISRFVGKVLNSFFSGLFILSFVVIYLFLFSPMLLVILAVVLALFLAVYFVCQSRMSKASSSFKEAQNTSYSVFNESLANASTIKLHDWKAAELKKHDRVISNYISAFRRTLKYSTMFVSVASSLQMIFVLSVFVVGSILILQDKLSVGDLVTLVSFASLVMAPIMSLMEIASVYPDAKVSYARLLQLHQLSKVTDGAVDIDHIDSIDLHMDSYGYNSVSLITNFSYTFEKGKIYFLSGHNGAGKSTLLNIISGLHSGYQGDIIINGQYCLKDVSRKTYYKHLTFVEQDTHLFSGTIRENIFYGCADGSISAVPGYLSDFMSSLVNLPSGLDTAIVGNLSTTVSGGEKQKAALIRDLRQPGDIILLDEPYSSLDKVSKRQLFEILEGLKKDHIIIIVAHGHEFDGFADDVVQVGAQKGA